MHLFNYTNFSLLGSANFNKPFFLCFNRVCMLVHGEFSFHCVHDTSHGQTSQVFKREECGGVCFLLHYDIIILSQAYRAIHSLSHMNTCLSASRIMCLCWLHWCVFEFCIVIFVQRTRSYERRLRIKYGRQGVRMTGGRDRERSQGCKSRNITDICSVITVKNYLKNYVKYASKDVKFSCFLF